MNPKSEFNYRWCRQFKKHLAVQAVTVLLGLATAHGQTQTYTVLHNFVGNDGVAPFAPLVVSGTTLYGTSEGGGNYGSGTVFKVNTDGSGYVVLHSFAGADGSVSRGALVLAGTMLFGTTVIGGVSNNGTVFRVNTDGSGYVVLHSFTGGVTGVIGSDGGCPEAGLVLGGTTLYGTTDYGGDFGKGTVFKMNSDGSDYVVLHSFTGSDGDDVLASLVLDGAILYGTTHDGGNYGRGTAFKVNTDGSGYVVLHSFSGGDGNSPVATLVLSGTTLYGTTSLGGAVLTNTGCGTVFKLNTDGSGFEVLRSFSGGDGCFPAAGMVLVGPRLYGTTRNGGPGYNGFPASGNGMVFTLNTNGSGFSVLKYFVGLNDPDGSRPRAGLVLSDTTMYGTTSSGGSGGHGVVFKFNPSFVAPTILTSPTSQTAETGGIVNFAARVRGDPLPTCQWFFNDTAITSCTSNRAFCLDNVQATNVGTYTVVVSNCFGAVTSDPVVLNVIPRVDRRAVPALNLLGETGSALDVEYADVLGSPTNWLPLDMVNLTAAPQLYLDVSAPLPPQRFYRVRQTGTPATPPSLKLPFMVPAITLTGNIGDQLRLDYINQFGPTDAWVNLDTVTLTNTSQLYFDLFAPSQPRRLYRIEPVP
jgi:uncharacterized repeat protein (TIGR03803 family)